MTHIRRIVFEDGHVSVISTDRGQEICQIDLDSYKVISSDALENILGVEVSEIREACFERDGQQPFIYLIEKHTGLAYELGSIRDGSNYIINSGIDAFNYRQEVPRLEEYQSQSSTQQLLKKIVFDTTGFFIDGPNEDENICSINMRTMELAFRVHPELWQHLKSQHVYGFQLKNLDCKSLKDGNAVLIATDVDDNEIEIGIISSDLIKGAQKSIAIVNALASDINAKEVPLAGRTLRCIEYAR